MFLCINKEASIADRETLFADKDAENERLRAEIAVLKAGL